MRARDRGPDVPKSPGKNIFSTRVCKITSWLLLILSICDALRDFVAFAQFKKREKHPWRSVF